jgi:hypothetical protein
MSTNNTTEIADEKKCFYCRKPIVNLVKHNITDRVRCEYTRKAKVRTRLLEFCSSDCATHCQYAHEG